MANYHCILFDLDNTLLDFDLAESKAIAKTLEDIDIEPNNENIQIYQDINESLWKKLEKGQIRRDKIATERFSIFLKKMNKNQSVSAVSRAYLDNLAMQGILLPDTMPVLDELAEVATLAVITNGFTKTAQARVANSGNDKYMEDVFISEKIGVDKPNRKIFDVALSTLGVEDRKRVLIVGDRLESDIKGGINAGIATCWFNPQGDANNTDIRPNFEISSLHELYKIVMEDIEYDNLGNKNRKHSI